MANHPQSIFDANTFMETTHKGGVSTTYILPDPGDYAAQITDKVEVRSGLIGEGKQRAGEPWASLSLQWEILDDAVRQKLNMDHVFVNQSLMLDLDENRQLDFGTNRNVRLGRLLDATGLNKQKSWTFAGFKFQTGTIKVDHRPDPNDPTIQYAEVTRVSAP